MTTGDAIAARARRCVGAPFRPQGRSCATGLDCIGVVAIALGVGGVRADYRLRGGSVAELEHELKAVGLQRIEEIRSGDVLLMRAGPEQLHLGIATDRGFVHAHAGLGRVVETLGAPEWPLLGIWRMTVAWRRTEWPLLP